MIYLVVIGSRADIKCMLLLMDEHCLLQLSLRKMGKISRLLKFKGRFDESIKIFLPEKQSVKSFLFF